MKRRASKKIKLGKNKISVVIGVFLVLFVAALGIHLLFISHATIPSTPTLSDVCGVTASSDIEAPETTPTSPSTAIQPVLLNQGGDFEIYPAQGSNPAELYALNGNTISIYNLNTGAQIGSSFNISSGSGFTIDPSGNVYAMSGFSLAKWNTSGAQQWQVSLPGAQYGSAYGYTNTNGTWFVAVTTSNLTSGTAVYNYTGGSLVYNESGTAQPNNDMYVQSNVVQDSTTGDIMGTDDGMMMRVYSQPSGSSDSAPLKFIMGTDMKGGGSYPWHFSDIQSVVENPAGGYFVSDYNDGMLSFDQNGGYIGVAPDFNQDNNAPNTIGVGPKESLIYNGNVYTYLTAGTDTFSSSEDTPGIYSISLANLNSYISYPQGPSGHLGIGAGLSSSATSNDNYYPSGSTPSINMTFYPWWASQASNFTVKYTVSSMEQYESNNLGPEQTIGLGGYLSPGATAPISIPVNTSADDGPGFYYVSARIYNNASPTVAVGSDCLTYSVGMPGDNYSPATFNAESNNTQAVELAHELGQDYVRASWNGNGAILDACLPGVTSASSSTTLNLNCPSALVSDIDSAQALASKYGITFAIEIAQTGDPNNLDNEIVSSGQWSSLVGQLAAEFPTVKDFMVWNEINNNGGNYGNGGWDATNIFKPAYQAIKAVSGSDFVIGGSSLNVSVGFWQQVGAAGGFQYMDDADIHPYPGFNKSDEEQGIVIPPGEGSASNPSGSGQIDQLKAVLSDTSAYAFNSGVTSLPISDSEMGFWRTGTISELSQADKIVTATVLQNSDGVTNIAPFANNGDYQISGETWNTVDGGYDGGDAPAALAQITMQNMLGGSTVQDGRTFVKWLSTGVPHTYAAEYGPSSTDSGDLVVVWADDYEANVVPTLSGGGVVNIVSEYGASSTVGSGGTLAISGDPQYLSIPAGQTMTIGPQESYGTNYALASNGATATASSTNPCSDMSPSDVLGGNVINQGTTCSSIDDGDWAQNASDTNPWLQINLASPETIDRLFISSAGIDSVQPGLRSFNVQVASSVGGTFNTVATVTNAFFDRNHLLSFPSQTVAEIRLVNISANYSGNGDGLPPTWWPISAAAQADNTNIAYGPDIVYDIEAYGPGSTTGNTTSPTVSISSPTNNATVSGTTTISASASENGGSIANVQFKLDGSNLGSPDTSAPYTYSWDTTSVSNGTYSLSAVATDSAGNPTTSSSVSVTVDNSTGSPTPSTPTGLNVPPWSSTGTDFTTFDSIPITWTASTDSGGPGIAGYYIYRTSGSTTTRLGPVTTTSYKDSGLTPGTAYTYKVQAFDSSSPAVESAESTPLAASTVIIGGIDGNSCVSPHDLSIFVAHYNTNWPPAEFDGNSNVGAHDLSIFVTAYTNSND
jgi:hypothetical protein